MSKLLITLLLFTCFQADAMFIERINNNTVEAIGSIFKNDADKLARVLKSGDTLIMRSSGGDAVESIFLYYTLQDIGGITVDATQGCNSACANMALAADKVIGKLGFHKARLPGNVKRKYTKSSQKRLQQEVDKVNALLIEQIWSNHFSAQFINNMGSELIFIEL